MMDKIATTTTDKQQKRRIQQTLKEYGVQSSGTWREYERGKRVVMDIIPECAVGNWQKYVSDWVRV